MNDLAAKQAALFKVQKWHAARIKSLEFWLRGIGKSARPFEIDYARKELRRLRKFIAAITPFLLPPP